MFLILLCREPCRHEMHAKEREWETAGLRGRRWALGVGVGVGARVRVWRRVSVRGRVGIAEGIAGREDLRILGLAPTFVPTRCAVGTTAGEPGGRVVNPSYLSAPRKTGCHPVSQSPSAPLARIREGLIKSMMVVQSDGARARQSPLERCRVRDAWRQVASLG